MKILVVNCGSSSLKYQLIDMENESVLAKGNFERIGEEEAFLTHKIDDKKYVTRKGVSNHKEALDIIKQEGTNYSNPSIDQQLQSKRFVMELILQSKQDNYSGIEVIKDKCPILSEAIMDYIIETNAINGIENLLTLIDTDKITEEFVIHLFKYGDLYADFNIILGYVPKELANELEKLKNISSNFGFDKTAVEKTLKNLDIKENLRGESLSIEQMKELSEELKKWL